MNSLLDMIFISKCIGCGEILNAGQNKKLCPACASIYEGESDRKCPVCARTADMCLCTPTRLKNTDKINGVEILKTAFYFPGENTLSNKLIYTLKRRKLMSVENFFAMLLAERLKIFFNSSGKDISMYCITYPPRTKENINKYGFDHCKKLARLVAKYTGTEFVSAFKNSDRFVQKNLSFEERAENTENAFAPRKNVIFKKHFIIIDDVITTGSTISSGAKVLKENGALSVFAAAIMMNAPKKFNMGTYAKKHEIPKPSDTPWFIS